MKNKGKKGGGDDKIFNNTFHSAEVNTSPISFTPDSVFTDPSLDSEVDRSIVEERLRDCLERCDWAAEALAREDAPKTVSKKELNSLFKFLFEKAGPGSSVEVFTFMVQEMDQLDPSRFYDHLSNSIKTEIHEELRRRGFLGDARFKFP